MTEFEEELLREIEEERARDPKFVEEENELYFRIADLERECGFLEKEVTRLHKLLKRYQNNGSI